MLTDTSVNSSPEFSERPSLSFTASNTQTQYSPIADVSPYSVVVPILSPHLAQELVALATAMIGPTRPGVITLTGIVVVPESSSLGEGASLVRAYRTLLHYMPADAQPHIKVRTLVRVAHDAAQGIIEVVNEQQADLLLLHWKGFSNTPGTVYGAALDQIMRDPPCDVALAHLHGQTTWPNILLPVRGGSYSQMAVQVARAISAERITLLHCIGPVEDQNRVRMRAGSARYARTIADAPFATPSIDDAEREAVANVHALLNELPPTANILTVRGNPLRAIMQEAQNHDLVIMGASAMPVNQHANGTNETPRIAERVAQEMGTKPFVIVKTHKAHELWGRVGNPSESANLAKKLDRWFAENTYHYREFRSMSSLTILKEQSRTSVSLVMPLRQRNLAALKTLHKAYMALIHDCNLVDEILVVDVTANPNDVPTPQWQKALDRLTNDPRTGGAIIYRALEMSEIGPHARHSSLAATGAALWRALHDNLLETDIVVWCDTLIETFEPRCVYGLLGPLLNDPGLELVCGFHTETNAEQIHDPLVDSALRPILSAFVPQLGGIINPLGSSGAARRNLLEQLPIVEGDGFTVALMADTVELSGLQAIGQVDLGPACESDRTTQISDIHVQAALSALMQRFEARLRAVTPIPANISPAHWLNHDRKTIERAGAEDLDTPDDENGRGYRVHIEPFTQHEHPPAAYARRQKSVD